MRSPISTTPSSSRRAHADTFTHRGNVYAELGDYNRATDDFQHALELNSNCADAYRSLAWLEATCPDERFRDPQQAVAAAERAAKLSPQGDCFVLDALAAAYASAGNFEAPSTTKSRRWPSPPKASPPNSPSASPSTNNTTPTTTKSAALPSTTKSAPPLSTPPPATAAAAH